MFEDLGPLRDSIRDVILTSDVDMGMICLTSYIGIVCETTLVEEQPSAFCDCRHIPFVLACSSCSVLLRIDLIVMTSFGPSMSCGVPRTPF